MCDIKIELMNNNHIEGVMVVENISFTVPWSMDAFFQEVNQNEFAIYFVAIVEGKVVGYAGVWVICDEGHITNIAVHPDFRRKGIGSLLMEKLITYAKAHDVAVMTLDVRAGNDAAKNMYAKFGFKKGGLRKEYYSDNLEDAEIMVNDVIQKRGSTDV
ncbi:MAG: ribosomal protein S18-alanine N-acetyltransferase [Clostridia bacterium]|jgi:ribosomal-protein-alanine N-acetyltransferase